ncbi:head-tail connector protein [Pseudooceanicola atlanticus]|uniref:Gene transfer agent protein n=1 Tax=Pseudooceanicola atlanticus TaxID=1461694 RepID=A0A0A0ED58_9RHOB|nr:head-tail connector protein [Pseudooceanicola atlanticus]KGM48861.1 gene transfer agent protein [Pseudooceanicola atlanticus]
MLIEENEIPLAALPVEDFKAHLRLGTGFTGDNVQDAVLESFLRAAMAAVEARTSKVLLSRGMVWTRPAWRNREGEVLPVGPVIAITRVSRVDAEGAEVDVDTDRYRLEPDLSFPRLCPRGAGLPDAPTDGAIRVRFNAGFGPAWSDLPADLRQAVMLLAAHYYENRDATGLGEGCMPFGVTSLLERYRPLRVYAGGRE